MRILINQPFYIVDQYLDRVEFQVLCESSIIFMITDHLSNTLNISIQNMHGKSELIFIIKRSHDINIDIKIALHKSYSSFNCIGIYNIKNMRLNIYFEQKHTARETEGNFTLCGVASDYAHIYFKGDLIMEENAQTSRGSMMHKTLINGKDTIIKTIPNLEIKTNNVSCKHAASIQQIDYEELFYMQSKGIKLELAKNLIINGFLGDSKKLICNKDGQQFFTHECVLL